jgi:GNAT superfamily N-acetyltransferase
MKNNTAEINIRQMQPGEEESILGIMRRAFPFFMQLTFSLAMIRSAKQVLVVCVDGDIKGGTLLKTFDLPGDIKGGVVDWIFTDPSGRGLGLGSRLMDASFDWFDQVGCDQIFAIVEGFNTNSSNLFARRGLSILTFKEQLQRFGFPGMLMVWLKTFHFFDLGHFLWGKPPQATADLPLFQLTSALLLNMIIAFLAVFRTSIASPDWGTLTILPLWVLILLGLRNSLMLLVAKIQALPLRYRLWETGFVISFIVMLLGGVFVPIPGSYYSKEKVWNYNRIKPQLGKIALAGSLPALLISLSLFFLERILPLSSILENVLATGFKAAFVIAVVDTLIPFFPFVSFNGRRLWDWNRWIWGLMAGVIMALWILMSLGV